jgi:hypothetical protein
VQGFFNDACGHEPAHRVRTESASLFTPGFAVSVKQAAVQDVLANLGPLKEKAVGQIGPLERIVEQAIEKQVVLAK